MLGVARIADMGLAAAVTIAAAIALLGLFAFDLGVALGLLVSPIAFMISSAVLAYVVLRHGEQPAMNTSLIAVVVASLVVVLLIRDTKLVMLFVALCWLSAVITASVLRTTVSLKWAVLCTVPVAAVVGLLVQFAKTNVAQFWQFSLDKGPSGLTEDELRKIGDAKLLELYQDMPSLLTELVSVWAYVIVLCSVFIARYWQAQLFNNGGFQKEFHRLRLGKEVVIVFAVVFFLAQLFEGSFLASIVSAIDVCFFYTRIISTALFNKATRAEQRLANWHVRHVVVTTRHVSA